MNTNIKISLVSIFIGIIFTVTLFPLIKGIVFFLGWIFGLIIILTLVKLIKIFG